MPGVAVGVPVTEGVPVRVGVSVMVTVGVTVRVGVTVMVVVGVAVGIPAGVFVGVGVEGGGVAVEVNVGVEVGDGVGVNVCPSTLIEPAIKNTATNMTIGATHFRNMIKRTLLLIKNSRKYTTLQPTKEWDMQLGVWQN